MTASYSLHDGCGSTTDLRMNGSTNGYWKHDCRMNGSRSGCSKHGCRMNGSVNWPGSRSDDSVSWPGSTDGGSEPAPGYSKRTCSPIRRSAKCCAVLSCASVRSYYGFSGRHSMQPVPGAGFVPYPGPEARGCEGCAWQPTNVHLRYDTKTSRRRCCLRAAKNCALSRKRSGPMRRALLNCCWNHWTVMMNGLSYYCLSERTTDLPNSLHLNGTRSV